MDRCAECKGFMDWPRRCWSCLLWFCDVCGPRSVHDCTGDDDEPEEWTDEDELP
jgi:hypothetical protein